MRTRAMWLVVLGLWAVSLSVPACTCQPSTPEKENKQTDSGSRPVPDKNLKETKSDTKPQPDQRIAPPERRVVPEPEPVVEVRPEPSPEPRVEPVVTPDKAPDNRPLPELKPDIAPPDRRPPAPVAEVRFIVMGDTGTGSSTQKAVAKAIHRKCLAEAKPGGRGPCEFVLLLGDNFYDVGVKSAKDPQFKTKFEDMYSFLKLPFYITIGNHDYGIEKIGGAGFGFHKFAYYRDYGKTNPLFVFPDKYYDLHKGNAHFVSLNTCELFFDVETAKQTKFVKDSLARAKKLNSVWKIGFGHHPYISNGRHGNAGRYEGFPIPIPFVSGTEIKKFFEKEICGKFDFYLAGHDHNLQVLQSKCGTNFVVSGAGAKTKKAGDTKRNKVHFQNFKEPGFMYFHIKGRTLTLEVWTVNGTKPAFSKTYTK